jgi:hypothetical protein
VKSADRESGDNIVTKTAKSTVLITSVKGVMVNVNHVRMGLGDSLATRHVRPNDVPNVTEAMGNVKSARLNSGVPFVTIHVTIIV